MIYIQINNKIRENIHGHVIVPASNFNDKNVNTQGHIDLPTTYVQRGHNLELVRSMLEN